VPRTPQSSSEAGSHEQPAKTSKPAAPAAACETAPPKPAPVARRAREPSAAAPTVAGGLVTPSSQSRRTRDTRELGRGASIAARTRHETGTRGTTPAGGVRGRQGRGGSKEGRHPPYDAYARCTPPSLGLAAGGLGRRSLAGPAAAPRPAHG
jgi:hypothetical protein